MEMVFSALTYLVTFLLGLVSGFAIETLKLKYQTIKDNWNDLKGPMEKIYDVVRSLYYDCDHALKVRTSNSDALNIATTQINVNLETYRNWYKSFEPKGGIKKLDSIDEELSSALVGISYFATYSEQDLRYVEERLSSFHEIAGSAERRLENFMKAKIPHYIIFGKRKLANWRECRF